MIVITAKMTCHPGRADDFIAAAQALIPPTLAEDGCQTYDLLQYVGDPLSFAFVEEWRDREALGAHSGTEALVRFQAVAKDCIAEQVVTVHTVEKTRRF
jgi:quinol monooxygenase YgiN